MAIFDVLVRGGEAVLPVEGRKRCDIGIRNGRIAALLAPGIDLDASEVIDASGKVVMPGAVDVHLHLGHGKDISRPRVAADADAETAAAAKGGVTSFVPYLMATGRYEDIFEEVIDITRAGARIDFGYHFIISTEEQLASVPAYIREYGAPSFKLFMNNRLGEGQRLGLPDIDDGFLFRLCELTAEHGGLVAPHPENIEVARVLRERVREKDPTGTGGLAAWNATRPAFVEAEAIARCGYLSRITDARLYVVHVSSAEALEAGLRAREEGADIILETCPHYLTHDIGWEGGDIGKINPPLREEADRERLWEAVIDGEIDTIGTDHVHRDLSGKNGGIWDASPGCPGLETLLPILITDGYHGRGLPLERIAEVASSAPARAMGLSHRKGAIAIGLDADLAIVDLHREWTLARADVVSSAGYSIYEDRGFKGVVTDVLVRGRAVVQDERLVDAAVGSGSYIERHLI